MNTLLYLNLGLLTLQLLCGLFIICKKRYFRNRNRPFYDIEEQLRDIYVQQKQVLDIALKVNKKFLKKVKKA